MLANAARMQKTTNTTVPNATPTVITSYNSGSASGSMSVDTAGGLIEISETGLYLLVAQVAYTATWGSGVQQVRISGIDQTESGTTITAPQQQSYNGLGPTAETITMRAVTALGSPDNAWVVTLDQFSGSSQTADVVAFSAVKLANLP